jgi:hypothetical protein
MLEFVFIQDLGSREVARKVSGKNVTYGSVDILEDELSGIERKRYCGDQRTRRTILSSSTDKNASYENPTRQPAPKTSVRSTHLPHEATM